MAGVEIQLAESTLVGRFAQEQLRAAFELVTAGMANWKERISTTIPASLREQVAAAVEHITGSEAVFEPEGSGVYLCCRAAGYYASCGA